MEDGHVHASSSVRSAPVVACSLCRRCKAKCVKLDPTDPQCERCKTVGCVCVFEKHRRGRKRVRGLDLPRAEPMLSGETTSMEVAHASDSTLRASDRQLHRMSSVRPGASQSDEDLEASSPDLDVGGHTDGDDAQLFEQPTHTANPNPFMSGADRPFSLRSLLHPTSGPKRSSARRGASGRNSDLVARGVMTLDMARRLFDFFLATLNPIIMLLDPNLHTFDYVRQRSMFLFTTIIAAAARFIAPALSGTIAGDVRECSIQAIFGSLRSIETVQSWMVMYFWKDPRDDRGWTYVGLLCRLAVEIGLDRTPLADVSNASESEIRERRNRIRTWMLAFMMDRALSSTTGRDWCIRGHDSIIQNARAFSDHPLRIHGDAVIAGFTELRRISFSAVDRITGQELRYGGRRGRDIARDLLTINYDLDEWRLFWENEMLRHCSPPRYWAYLRFFELHIRLTLNSFAIDIPRLFDPGKTRGDDNGSNGAAERYCYDLATESLVQLQRVRDLDVTILQHAQDSIAIMVAYAACFLRFVVNSHHIDITQRDRAVALIDVTSGMFKTVSHDRETTAALQAEYLESLVADQHCQRSANSVIAPLHADELGIIGRSHENFAFDTRTDASNAPGPSLDFTDFESWLSSFESSAIPDLNSNVLPVHGDATNESLVVTNDSDLSNTAPADWDAIFLSWVNPEGHL